MGAMSLEALAALISLPLAMSAINVANTKSLFDGVKWSNESLLRFDSMLKDKGVDVNNSPHSKHNVQNEKEEVENNVLEEGLKISFDKAVMSTGLSQKDQNTLWHKFVNKLGLFTEDVRGYFRNITNFIKKHPLFSAIAGVFSMMWDKIKNISTTLLKYINVLLTLLAIALMTYSIVSHYASQLLFKLRSNIFKVDPNHIFESITNCNNYSYKYNGLNDEFICKVKFVDKFLREDKFYVTEITNDANIKINELVNKIYKAYRIADAMGMKKQFINMFRDYDSIVAMHTIKLDTDRSLLDNIELEYFVPDLIITGRDLISIEKFLSKYDK